MTLIEFLKAYNVLNAVEHFGQAWSQITRKNMRGMWNKLLLRTEKTYESNTNEIIEDVVNLGQQIGVEGGLISDIIFTLVQFFKECAKSLSLAFHFMLKSQF